MNLCVACVACPTSQCMRVVGFVRPVNDFRINDMTSKLIVKIFQLYRTSWCNKIEENKWRISEIEINIFIEDLTNFK